MSEAEDGFLSEAISSDVCFAVRSMYVEYCTLLNQANRLAVARQHAILIHVDNNIERYAACLFARTLATVQASVLLLERGLIPQARMLLRSALETLFALGAIAENPNVVDRLIEGHAAEQKRVAKSMQLWQHPELKEIADAEATVLDLRNFLDSPATALSAFYLAEKAGLVDWYRTVYMVYSWPVHGAATDLDRHVVLGPDAEASEFRNEAEVEGQESTWLCCIEILLKSLAFLGKIFSGVDQAHIDRLYGEACALHRKSLELHSLSK